jgi:hypothetical protein
MKVLSVEDNSKPIENRAQFPFFAYTSEGTVVMFISDTCGIGIRHSSPSLVGRVTDGWFPLSKRNSDGSFYWQTYHGKITLEV